MKALVVSLILVIGCEHAPTPGHEKAKEVGHPVSEGDLAFVRLTESAEKRLGIETTQVASKERPETRTLGAEVIVPPGRTATIAAPVAGVVRPASTVEPGSPVKQGATLMRVFPLAPVARDARAGAKRTLESAEARLAAADSRLARTTQLAEGQAASRRAIEEATADRDVAKAEVDAARSVLDQITSAPLLSDTPIEIRAPEDGIIRAITVVAGQAVPAGAPLLEIIAAEKLWVRVPMSSSQLGLGTLDVPITIQSLSRSSGADWASCPKVPGPPTGDATKGTVDVYCALNTASASFRPGERVLARVPLRATEKRPTIPASAVFKDASGSSWTYICLGERAYRRQRIEIVEESEGLISYSRGPAAGTCVVSTGVMEIYGSEFEPGH